MKTVKIVENENDCRRVVNEAIKYLEKHGIRVFAIVGESPALNNARILNITNPTAYGPKTCIRMLDAYTDLNHVVAAAFADALTEKVGEKRLNEFLKGVNE